MAKYIDSEKLITEINKLCSESCISEADDYYEFAKSEICDLIDSLQQEQPEVDLAEEITRFFSKNPITYEHITDWSLLKNTAIHFYELGLNARKED